MDGDATEGGFASSGTRGRSKEAGGGSRPMGDGVGSKRRRPASASASGPSKSDGRKRPAAADPKEKPRKLDTARFLRGGEDSKVAKSTSDVKLKAQIKRKDKEFREAAMDAARAELLLTEDSG